MDVRIDYSKCMAAIIGEECGTPDESFAESAPVLSDCLRALESRREMLGPSFYEISRTNEIKALLDFAEETLPDVEHIVVAGPAGSSLGGRVLHGALDYPPAMEGKRIPGIHFLDSIDPDAVTAVLYKVNDLRLTQFHLIGNSGNLAQEVALSTVIHQQLHKERINPRNQIVTLAPPDSMLWKQAKEEGCRTFAVPKHAVGLRNILTPASFLWAVFAEIDIVRLLEGARRMAERCRNPNMMQNPAAVLTHLWNHPARFVELIPVVAHLRALTEWFTGLMGPQRGPAKSPLGMFVRVERARSDYRLQGDVFADSTVLSGKTLHQVILEEQAATASALAQKGQPNLTLHLDRIQERSLGALLCLLEFTIDLHAEFRSVTAEASTDHRGALREPVPPPQGKYVL